MTARDTKDEVDLIEVAMTHEAEIEADHADLFVTVKGSSLVTGGAVLSKAREVAALVAALGGVGVPQADIKVENITAQVESGLLGKSSSATYELKVRCTKLETLADVLGAVTSQKNADLGRIAWGYPDRDAARTGWLVDCATRATVRAKHIADALGVKVLGVHRFGEPEVAHRFGSQELGAPAGGAPPMALRARSMSAADLGLTVAHSKKVEVRVAVVFRVGPYAGA